MDIFEKFLHDPEFDQLNNMVRWNGMNRIKDETVAHHSYIVTWFSRVLAEEIFDCDSIKLKIISYALFHDFDEMFTGDILHPLKYNKFNGTNIKQSIDDYLDFKINEKFSSDNNTDKMFRNLLMKDFPDYVSKIVKLADWLSMYFYINKEMQLGNKSITEQRRYCIESILKACEDCVVSLSSEENDFKVNIEIITNIKKLNFL
jgi:5'-deoxynucleotidase YfbR-like HD superfamily hydrolase